MNFTLDTEKVNNFIKSQNRNEQQSYITKSGVYPVTINYVSINEYKTGSKSFTINYTLEGSKESSSIYGSVFEKADKSICSVGYNQIQSLQLVFGLKDLTLTKKKVKLFNGEEVELDVFKEIQGKKCLIQVLAEYSKYADKISKRILFRDIFRKDDKASAIEIANKAGYGNKMKWIEQNEERVSQPSYRDVSDEEVKQWYASKKGESKASAKTIEEELDPHKESELPF